MVFGSTRRKSALCVLSRASSSVMRLKVTFQAAFWFSKVSKESQTQAASGWNMVRNAVMMRGRSRKTRGVRKRKRRDA